MGTALSLIPLALLAGAALNGFFSLWSAKGRSVSRTLVHVVACAAPLFAFAMAIQVWRGLGEAGGRITTQWFEWIAVGDLRIGLDLTADPLTCVMLLVITGIGSLIHIYSTAYMHEEEGFARYFSALNLFTFFMTILVLGKNLAVLFVGWEGVGLCSYLLIGYWWKDSEKATAGMKAFVVNRVGDFGFLIALFLLWRTAGTLDFAGIQAYATSEAGRSTLLGPSGILGASVATLIGLLLFWGATGKSAQIPLYVWLPDAMAGPTPVSALIHAATMVTAGVYMVARLNFLYALSPVAQGTIMVVAGVTSLFAGVMALAQTDIKKVLAYSTISQIGYMMLGVGTGYVAAGMFHVVTHAFFKAALFLGSGSVIHACHHEQDMRHMGGLRKKMPWTCAAMTLSAAAMAGVPPLSGFFSKDEILWRAFSHGTMAGKIGWLCGFLGALLTAFYMFRLIFMTFGGSYRGHAHPHEVPKPMWMTQGTLALGSAIVGFLGVPHILGGHDIFGHYLAPIIPDFAQPNAAHGEHAIAVEWSLMAWSVVMGLAGISAAWWAYVKKPELPGRITAKIPKLHALVRDKFRVDEAYTATVVRPTESLARQVVLRGVDQGLIEGIVNGLGSVARLLGRVLSFGQTGLLRGYVGIMILGALLLLLSVLG